MISIKKKKKAPKSQTSPLKTAGNVAYCVPDLKHGKSDKIRTNVCSLLHLCGPILRFYLFSLLWTNQHKNTQTNSEVILLTGIVCVDEGWHRCLSLLYISMVAQKKHNESHCCIVWHFPFIPMNMHSSYLYYITSTYAVLLLWVCTSKKKKWYRIILSGCDFFAA